MARSSKIRVMISSRCNDKFPSGKTGRALSGIRRELKAEIGALELFGTRLFEVWINESAPPGGGTWDSWETCIQAVNDCDILIVLSNGNAGWAQGAGEIGICHAELMAGLSKAPGKVRLISLPSIAPDKSAAGVRNRRFQEYVSRQSLFRGGEVATEADLKLRVKEALGDALIALTQSGVREASRGRFHSGEALDWSRLDFKARQSAMQDVLRDALKRRDDTTDLTSGVSVHLAGTEVLCIPDAIPAALTVTQAKEMVGQPFLRDYRLVGDLSKKGGERAGPLHIIACHKGATEAQATKLLGFPDATVVSAPFGVFVADNIQKIQFAFIVNCRDETTTRHGLQRLIEWMAQTGEDRLVAERAKARARIVAAIAKETAA
jgi:hypothetical protein